MWILLGLSGAQTGGILWINGSKLCHVTRGLRTLTKHLRIDDFVVVNVVNTNLENIARRDCVTRATVAEAIDVGHATGYPTRILLTILHRYLYYEP